MPKLNYERIVQMRRKRGQKVMASFLVIFYNESVRIIWVQPLYHGRCVAFLDKHFTMIRRFSFRNKNKLYDMILLLLSLLGSFKQAANLEIRRNPLEQ